MFNCWSIELSLRRPKKTCSMDLIHFVVHLVWLKNPRYRDSNLGCSIARNRRTTDSRSFHAGSGQSRTSRRRPTSDRPRRKSNRKSKHRWRKWSTRIWRHHQQRSDSDRKQLRFRMKSCAVNRPVEQLMISIWRHRRKLEVVTKRGDRTRLTSHPALLRWPTRPRPSPAFSSCPRRGSSFFRSRVFVNFDSGNRKVRTSILHRRSNHLQVLA